VDGQDVAAVQDLREERSDVDRFDDTESRDRLRTPVAVELKVVIETGALRCAMTVVLLFEIGDVPVVVAHVERERSERAGAGRGKGQAHVARGADVLHRTAMFVAITLLPEPAGIVKAARPPLAVSPTSRRTRMPRAEGACPGIRTPLHPHRPPSHIMTSKRVLVPPKGLTVTHMISHTMIRVIYHHGRSVDFDSSAVVGAEAESVGAGSGDLD